MIDPKRNFINKTPNGMHQYKPVPGDHLTPDQRKRYKEPERKRNKR